MSRLIKTETAGKERTRMTKAIVAALRELAAQPNPGSAAKDLVAFIVLGLDVIAETIDVSVAAWEKRDYWVKADRFRMEWRWTGEYAATLRQALRDEDWGQIALLSVQIGSKLGNIKVSDNHRMGTPWVGAYRQLLTSK